jgi:hypothetical protein
MVPSLALREPAEHQLGQIIVDSETAFGRPSTANVPCQTSAMTSVPLPHHCREDAAARSPISHSITQFGAHACLR